MTEILNFWTNGENFTRMIRDLWDSNLVLKATNICVESGMPLKEAIEVCIGKLKFVGDTREGDHTLSIEEDNFETEFSVDYQIEILEEEFKDLVDLCSQIKRKKLLGSLPSASACEYRCKSEGKNDSLKLEDSQRKLKEIINNLNILYPLIGKAIGDLPFSSIESKYLTNPEINKIEQVWEDLERRELFRKEEIKSRELYVQEFNKEFLRKEELSSKPIAKEIKGDEFNGWIDRKGMIFECDAQGHIFLSKKMQEYGLILKDVENTEEYLENQGFLKLSSGKFIYLNSKSCLHDKRMTKQQKDAVMFLWSCFNSSSCRLYIFNFTSFENIDDAIEYMEKRA